MFVNHCLVIRSGFEPETHSLEGCCSIQLSYQTSRVRQFRALTNDLVVVRALNASALNPNSRSLG